MNIQDEIKNDRLAFNFERPSVFIRKDLYWELRDTSMFPHALRVMRIAFWKRWILWLFSVLSHAEYELTVEEMQFKFYLNKLLDYVNEERVRTLGMMPEAVVGQLNFAMVEDDGRPLWYGVYAKERDEYYMHPAFNDNLNHNDNNGAGTD